MAWTPDLFRGRRPLVHRRSTAGLWTAADSADSFEKSDDQGVEILLFPHLLDLVD